MKIVVGIIGTWSVDSNKKVCCFCAHCWMLLDSLSYSLQLEYWLCRVDEAHWFLSASCKSPAIDAGHKRQARSCRCSGGPKLNRIHRDTQQSAVSNDRQSVHSSGHQNNRLQCTRMQSRPNGHCDRHITQVTSLTDIMYNNTTALSPSTSQYSLVRSRPAPQSTAGSRARKWLYLSQNNSESSDSSCVGFPAGPTIARKLKTLIFRPF